MTEWPRPGWFLVVSSILLIGTCLFALSITIAGCCTAKDPLAIIEAIFVIPMVTTIGFQQYRGVFRNNPRAANMTAFVLMLLGGLPVFGCVVVLVQTAWEHRLSGRLFLVLSALGAIGTFCLLVAFAEHHWAYVLTHARKSVAAEKQPKWRQFSLREMLLWTTVLAVTIGVTMWLIQSS